MLKHMLVSVSEKIEKPQALSLEVVFAKMVDGEIVRPDTPIGKDAIYVIGGAETPRSTVRERVIERVSEGTAPVHEVMTVGLNESKPAPANDNKEVVTVGFGESKSAPASSNDGDEEDQPLMKAEILPSFHGGGLPRYQDWVQGQIVYPAKLQKKGIGGRVTVEFVVEKDGSVTFSKILQSPHKLFSEEVERVIKSSPKWTPGRQRGEPVKAKFQMRINFSHPEFRPSQVKALTTFGYE